MKALEFNASIGYLNATEQESIAQVFTDTVYHSSQDPYRSNFNGQPVFICKKGDAIVGYALIELNSLKRGTIWFGPVYNAEAAVEDILNELLKACKAYGIWALTVYPKDDAIAQVIEKLSRSKAMYLIDKQPGLCVAIKNLERASEDIKSNYSRGLKRNLAKAVQGNVVIEELNDAKDFDQLVQVFIGMYQHKQIPIDPHDTRTQLVNEFDYVTSTKRGHAIVAKKDGKVVGGIIQLYTSKVAVYIHAASDKSCPFPVLHAAVDYGFSLCKARGIAYYDFGSYFPATKEEQFIGINNFKTSFGSDIVQYPPIMTYTSSWMKALLYRALQKIITIINALLFFKPKSTIRVSFKLS